MLCIFISSKLILTSKSASLLRTYKQSIVCEGRKRQHQQRTEPRAFRRVLVPRGRNGLTVLRWRELLFAGPGRILCPPSWLILVFYETWWLATSSAPEIAARVLSCLSGVSAAIEFEEKKQYFCSFAQVLGIRLWLPRRPPTISWIVLSATATAQPCRPRFVAHEVCADLSHLTVPITRE